MSGLIMLLTRWYLARENRLRDEEKTHTSSNAKKRGTYQTNIEEVVEVYLQDSNGEAVGKVDRAFLDLTDIENREFRYVL